MGMTSRCVMYVCQGTPVTCTIVPITPGEKVNLIDDLLVDQQAMMVNNRLLAVYVSYQ